MHCFNSMSLTHSRFYLTSVRQTKFVRQNLTEVTYCITWTWSYDSIAPMSSHHTLAVFVHHKPKDVSTPAMKIYPHGMLLAVSLILKKRRENLSSHSFPVFDQRVCLVNFCIYCFLCTTLSLFIFVVRNCVCNSIIDRI